MRQNEMGNNKIDNNKIIARIDLQGVLILSSETGQIFETDPLIQSLNGQGLLAQKIGVVWVPSQSVLLTSVFVPGKRKTDWAAALPFALEEALSEPIENFHIVALNRSAQGVVSAGLVEHTLMQKWIQLLENHGLEHAALVADCFSVPLYQADEVQASPQWSLYSDDNLCIVRTDQYAGFASTPEWLEEIRLLIGQGETQKLPVLHTVSQLSDSSIQSLKTVSALNLRTGDYTSQSRGFSGLQRWKWHLSVLFLILLSFLGQTLIETQRLQTQATQYKAETETLFKTLFPEVKRVINIRLQTKSKLNQGDAFVQVGPSQLINEIESAFKLFPVVKIQKIQWTQKYSSGQNSRAGRLTIAVESLNTQALEDLDARLQLDKVSGQVSLQIKNVTPKLVEGVFYVDAN